MDAPRGAGPATELLRRRIADAGGALPLPAFLETALYAPEVGYYARAGATTGRAGDFSTSADVSPAFGERLAVQLAELWERSGKGPWRLVELGPGRGLTVIDVLRGLERHTPAARAALEELTLVEPGAGLRAAQAARLDGVAPDLPRRWVQRAEEVARRPELTTLVVGNEVLDALPVASFVRRGEDHLEHHVAVGDDGGFVEVERPPASRAALEIVRRYGLCPRDGDRAEACPAIDRLLRALADEAGARAALFVDYGHDASRLADEAHAEGTLVAYAGHRIVEDVYARPGAQDVTAHVNWSHVEDAAQAAGFEVAGRARQDRVLLALGLVEDLVRAETGEEGPAALGRRLAARSLIMPGAGGGRRFQVLFLTRGLDGPLRGLRSLFG